MNKGELTKIKQIALEEHIPIIMDDTLQVIAKILEEKKPNRILEIGTAVGYSAICFSEYLNKNGRIDTIERDIERVKEARLNIEKAEVEDKIQIYEGDAVEILPTLNEKYDIVFIDAAKGKYPFFLNQALRMIKDYGIIIADNVLYKGYVMSDYNKHKQRTAVRNLREYIAEITNNANLDTEILEVGDGLAISKLNNIKIIDFEEKYATEIDNIEADEWEADGVINEFNNGSIIKVAIKENEVIGTIYGKIIGDLFILDVLIIKKEYRSSGIGTKLMMELFNVLNNNEKVKNILVKAVFSNNKMNIEGLMKKFEFKEVLRVKGWWGSKYPDVFCKICNCTPCQCTCVFHIKELNS